MREIDTVEEYVEKYFHHKKYANIFLSLLIFVGIVICFDIGWGVYICDWKPLKVSLLPCILITTFGSFLFEHNYSWRKFYSDALYRRGISPEGKKSKV